MAHFAAFYTQVHGGLQSGKRTKQLGKTPVIKQNLNPTWNWSQKLYLKEQTNDLARLERLMPLRRLPGDDGSPATTARDRPPQPAAVVLSSAPIHDAGTSAYPLPLLRPALA